MVTQPGLLLPIVVLLQLWGTHGYNPETCGKQPLAPKHSRTVRVVGGVDALPGMWPWLVSIQIPTSKGPRHSCGGSLLAKQWVLTAAHCFKTNKSLLHLWRIVVGATDLSKLPDHVQLHTVSKVVLHQEYNPRTEDNDIALIQLDSPVTFNNYTQPACLPRVTMGSETSFTSCTVSGWGITAQNSVKTSDVLQEAKVNILETKKCNSSQWYNGAMSYHTLCAGYEEGGIDTCQGDSGGPLMCKMAPTSPYYVVGITSWGKGCGEANRPGIYTSTQHFLEWILGEMIEIDGRKATEETHPQEPRTKDSVAPLPVETVASQGPEDLLGARFTHGSPELSSTPDSGNGQQRDQMRLDEAEPSVTLQAPFIPPGFHPLSMQPPYLLPEQTVTLEPPVYPRESLPKALPPPYMPKEIAAPSLKPPFIPPELRVTVEPPYVAEQQPYPTPEPPILPTQPKYISFQRTLGPPDIPSPKSPSTEGSQPPLDLPISPPGLPYRTPGTAVSLEHPYIPPAEPYSTEHPYAPLAAQYTPLEPPFVPPEAPAFLEDPYDPPEKPHPIEHPYVPPQPHYSPPQAPYIPEETTGLLEQPYFPPRRRRPPAFPKPPAIPAGLPYNPPQRAASLERLDTPPEEGPFLQPQYIHQSLEPPKMPQMDQPQHLVDPPAGQHTQGLPVGLEPPALSPVTLGSRERQAAPPGKL